MHYSFGPIAFVRSPRLRDVTPYLYESADDRQTLRITPAHLAPDALTLLQSSRTALEKVYGPYIYYSRSIDVTDGHGNLAPAMEGQLADIAGGPPRRFGLAAIARREERASLLYIGNDEPFLPWFRALVRSVRFVSAMSHAPPVAAGFARRQAECVVLDVPASWSSPTTLFFCDDTKEDVTIRLTLDEPACERGSISMTRELPLVSGARVSILHETSAAVMPGSDSWTAEWSVEFASPMGTRLVRLRKSSLHYRDDAPVLTMYGHAPSTYSTRLDAAWDALTRTLATRVNT